MKRRVIVASCLVLAVVSIISGNFTRAAHTKEARPRPSVKKPLDVPDRNRAKAAQDLAQDQVSGERQAAVQSATVNFAELARREALTPAAPEALHFVPEPEEEAEMGNRPVPDSAKVIQQESVLSAPELLGPSPIASASFQGVDATGWIPPDTQGVAGPNHLMAAVNGGVLVQNKSGGVVVSVRSLVTFFSSVLNGSTDVFDPRLQYDPYGNRWILVAVADRNSANSSVVVGVSQTSDPTGNWYLSRIDADAANQSWADYPVIGFNKDWIVVSLNMFANTGSNAQFYSRFFVLNKANFFAGGSFYTQISAPNGVSGTMVPSTTYDPNLSTMYVLQTWNGNFSGNGYLRLYSITGAVGAEVLNNTSSAIFITTPNPWAYGPPSGADFAPQVGTLDKIQVNDSGMQNVVYRNGSLWCAHTVFLPAAGPTRSSVQWWQVNPTNASVQQLGRVDDASGNLFYAFPSIAVNSNNDVLIGYARFSATQYAGGGYAFRAGADAANSLRDDTSLKTGLGTYFNSFGARNRWGDYSGTSVDPVNDTEMWTIQEYATATNNWSTWWGRVTPPGYAATRTLTVTSSTPDSGINITVSPNDINGLGSGTTLFTRAYNTNASVTLAAPTTAGSSNFQKWQRNGADLATTPTVNVTMDANYTLTAVYSSGNSVYDATLRAPKCGQPSSFCDSGTLLNGRDTILGGPEPNQPNAINNSCADGTSGSYHSDESIDKIRVSTLDGSNFAPGKTVKIEATVWAYATTDHLDLYYAADVTSPTWTYITTLTPSATGVQVLSANYTLPSGGLQAVRASFRYVGTASSCGTNSGFDDYDDLIFTASAGLTKTSFDFEGDKKADITVYRPSNGYWFIINSLNSQVRVTPWGLPGDMAVPADYDGDGKTDVAVYRPSNGLWFIINSSNPVRIQQWGTPSDVPVPVPADYDGDGRADIAVFRPSDGNWFIIQSSNQQVRIQQWALSGDKPVPYDYDGDGKADIAVYRPSNGYWFIIQSSNNQVRIVPWGLPGDLTVAADYDGDGKTDVAVYRPLGGLWFIVNSTGQVRIQQWGLSGDVPVAGDYDGDGKADLAVYRPSDGNWFIIKSSVGGPPSTANVRIQRWGLPGDMAIPSVYNRP